MPSIAQGQRAFLGSGLASTLGSRKDEFVPASTLGELATLVGELIEEAQKNLNTNRSNASGNLSDSIRARPAIIASGLIQIDIEMNFYGQFVNKGVKGTRSGGGLYSFKSDMPGKSMVDAFKKYMKDARSKIGSIKTPIGHEIKNKKISEAASAFAMARATKQHGIKATGFMDKAIDATDQKVSARLSDALAIDILNSLPDNLN